MLILNFVLGMLFTMLGGLITGYCCSSKSYNNSLYAALSIMAGIYFSIAALGSVNIT
jgi:hypothetical protein